MGVDIGIIGLPQSGRTTIFQALTRGRAGGESHAPHVASVKVPEPRLEVLADMLHPKRLVPAEVRYIDIEQSVKEISGPLLAELGQVDAIFHVVRAFADDSVPHVEGTLDVGRDIAAIDLELACSDLAIIERRLGKINASLKGAQPLERQTLAHERELLLEIKAELEREVPIRELSLTESQTRAIAGYSFLTARPLLRVVNIGEEQLDAAASLEAGFIAGYSRPRSRVITLCAKLEKELGELEDEVAASFRADYGLSESGLDRTIKLSSELLGLITFFSIAHGEIRAWPLRDGTAAVKAAGKIHSDMERGFIRAEVISYDDMLKCGSLAEAKKHGRLRLEGKNYVVQEGDIITFLFNV